jgi:hypothetical protein
VPSTVSGLPLRHKDPRSQSRSSGNAAFHGLPMALLTAWPRTCCSLGVGCTPCSCTSSARPANSLPIFTYSPSTASSCFESPSRKLGSPISVESRQSEPSAILPVACGTGCMWPHRCSRRHRFGLLPRPQHPAAVWRLGRIAGFNGRRCSPQVTPTFGHCSLRR